MLPLTVHLRSLSCQLLPEGAQARRWSSFPGAASFPPQLAQGGVWRQKSGQPWRGQGQGRRKRGPGLRSHLPWRRACSMCGHAECSHVPRLLHDRGGPMKTREGKQLAQGHTDSKGQGQGFEPTSARPSAPRAGAYILLQTVHRACDLRGSWLPVVLSQRPGQVLLQLVTQLKRVERKVASAGPAAPILVPRPPPKPRQLTLEHHGL